MIEDQLEELPPKSGLRKAFIARTTPQITPVPATPPGQYVIPAALTKPV